MQPGQEFFKKQEVWRSPEQLSWLLQLHSGNKQAQQLELAMCKEDPWRWITHWVKTEDTQNKENPFKPFPDDMHLQVISSNPEE